MLSIEQINQIKSYFITQPVLKAYLFGSQARNEASENSDIDILVELDYKTLSAWDFIDMSLYLNNLLKTEIDLVSADAVSKHILPFIEKEKKLIYER